jgi:hypothetical protein
MRYFYSQFESEVSRNLLQCELPSLGSDTYSQVYMEEILEYFKIYENLDLGQLNNNFNTYTSKILSDQMPYSKAKFHLNRMLIYDVNKEFDDSYRPIMDHSFVKPTCKHLNFLKSANFRAFMQQSIRLSKFQWQCNPHATTTTLPGKNAPQSSSPNITTERSPPGDEENTGRGGSSKQAAARGGEILHKRRRQSMMSNYNRRTYNKETVQERGFG